MVNLKKLDWQVEFSTFSYCDRYWSQLDILGQTFDDIWCSISESVHHVSDQVSNVSVPLIFQLYLWFQLTSQNVLRSSASPLLIFKGLSEKFLGYNFYVNIPLKTLNPLMYLNIISILNCSWNCCPRTMNWEVTGFEKDFEMYILKICDIFANSNFFYNQNISMDSRSCGECLWYEISRKNFFLTWSNFKNRAQITKVGK